VSVVCLVALMPANCLLFLSSCLVSNLSSSFQIQRKMKDCLITLKPPIITHQLRGGSEVYAVFNFFNCV
jgi:hypothetical protein